MRLILCNCPPEHAQGLARALVQRKLAACVNILPHVQSVYMWEGALCEEQETTLLIKSTSKRVEELIETLSELHPYDVPEIIAVPIQEGYAPYLRWVDKETTPPTSTTVA